MNLRIFYFLLALCITVPVRSSVFGNDLADVTDEEGHYFMALVEEVDPAIRAEMDNYPVTACFKHGPQPEIIHENSHPVMVIPANKEWYFVTKEDLESLAKGWHNEYQKIQSSLPHNDLTDVTDEEGHYFMALVREVDPAIGAEMYNYPVTACFKHGPQPEIIHENSHPVMVIPAEKQWYLVTKEDLESLARDWHEEYQKIQTSLPHDEPPAQVTEIPEEPSVPLEERTHYLNILRQLAPKLFRRMTAVDPTGENHIKRYSDSPTGASVLPSIEDGLPIFNVGSEIINLPEGEQAFVIGHELGHYALSHPKAYTVVHDRLASENSIDLTDPKESQTLPFEETFKKNRQRIKEFEADRFSILVLGNNIEDGVAWMDKKAADNEYYKIKKLLATSPSFRETFNTNSEYWKKLEDEERKKTFKTTHPLWLQRIEHLKSLEPEVELQQAHGTPRPAIDWDGLIAQYKKNSWQELQESL